MRPKDLMIEIVQGASMYALLWWPYGRGGKMPKPCDGWAELSPDTKEILKELRSTDIENIRIDSFNPTVMPLRRT